MLAALGITVAGAACLYLDERKIDRDFWIALVIFTATVWGAYLTGAHRGLFG